MTPIAEAPSHDVAKLVEELRQTFTVDLSSMLAIKTLLDKLGKDRGRAATALESLSRDLAEARADAKGWRDAAHLSACEAGSGLLAEAEARIATLETAIDWALGEGNSDFGDNKPENAKPFWWRTELRQRAGRARSVFPQKEAAR